ncbi:hypothetical protein N7481_004138 [Penicillium waksmanii]|uniref:uncharacterized protein n=1 Tax=Penicillium waksmanii TaxID=69791 RepID=UPI0025472C0A|nr:uncharacterized protein N7481_004138 [Penicillium waksmanii]KAJ5988928.1 hypothetical protein N7481_004138 [Penicillium waksmanii]
MYALYVNNSHKQSLSLPRFSTRTGRIHPAQLNAFSLNAKCFLTEIRSAPCQQHSRSQSSAGTPLDWAIYRHTALHVGYIDGEDQILHVAGAHPFFEYSPQSCIPADTGLKIEALITVANPSDEITKSMIEKACAQTPVRNDPHHQDWNCHNWVGEALTELVDIGFLTEEQRSQGITRMVDACLEAEEEAE